VSSPENLPQVVRLQLGKWKSQEVKRWSLEAAVAAIDPEMSVWVVGWKAETLVLVAGQFPAVVGCL
jgi:hypothetical protein